MHRADVVVIGGGVIGLAAAWRMGLAGLSVVVVDPEPGRGASWAAAGMLAPVTEAHFGEEPLLELNLASARLWASFASELEAAAGQSVGYLPSGTVLAAFDDGDRALAEQLYRFQLELGLDVQWLTGRQARTLEPGLAPGVRAGMVAPGDHQVDNRRLVGALLAVVDSGERTSILRQRATDVVAGGGRVGGVRTAEGTEVAAGCVVVAAGCWSPAVGGAAEGLVPAVRPVKGQILRMAPRRGGPDLSRAVRGLVEGVSMYLVPRADGSLVVGATVEEQGFDCDVTADGVYQLLRDARRIVPATAEMHLQEAMAGLRPGSPDNAPVIGPSPGLDGLVIATGHYRNGVLLAPVTAAAVAAIATGAAPPPSSLAFGPGRFSQVPC